VYPDPHPTGVSDYNGQTIYSGCFWALNSGCFDEIGIEIPFFYRKAFFLLMENT
jgi:hypothetical protein